MKLELNKNELERALIALGKLVSRTASLPQFRSLKIEATEKEIRFSTCTPLEQITFRMESPSEGSFHCFVPFEEFRMALRSCRNKTLELEYGEGILHVGETTLLHEQSVEWPIICKGEQEAYSELPKEFLCACHHAGDQSFPRRDYGDERQRAAAYPASAECG